MNRPSPVVPMVQADLVDKLVEARSMGKADPSLIDDFNKEILERKWVI